jgi:hypothetical protein
MLAEVARQPENTHATIEILERYEVGAFVAREFRVVDDEDDLIENQYHLGRELQLGRNLEQLLDRRAKRSSRAKHRDHDADSLSEHG